MISHCFGDDTRLFDPHYFGRQKVLRQSEMINLFIGNLENDLGETKNIAAKHPEIVKRLTAYMNKFEQDIKKNSRPIGKAKNPRTLVPRPGAEGEDAYTPTLLIGKTK